MEVFNFCWLTLLTESKKCSVFFDKNTYKVKNECDENFEKPINRVSYLYKFGSFNICFFNRCFTDFVSNVPDALKIVDNICSTKNLNICSLSTGPGTDIVGLLYSLHQMGKPLKQPITFKVISKHGAWRNLVTQMIHSQIASIPDSSNSHLIQCDILTELTTKAQGYIKNADVILMCRSFSSPRATQLVMCGLLKEILQLLKPGALVFFITSKEKSAYFKELNTHGCFLYGPTEVTMKSLPYDKKIADWIEIKPIESGSAYFAVWQKSPPSNLDKQNVKVNTEESQSNTSSNYCVFPKVSPGKTMPQTRSDSSSSIRSCVTLNDKKSTLKETATSLGTPHKKESAKFVDAESMLQATISNKTLINHSNKSCPPSNTKPLTSNLKIEPLKDTSTKHENPMNSLLKRFEVLVSNLEDFIGSQDIFIHSQNQKDLINPHTNSGHAQNTHCDNLGSYDYTNQCCVNSRFHSACASSCGTNSRGPAMICSNTYSCHHNCSVYNDNHMYQNVVGQETPYIVVPLQNLPGNTLAQILSLASQSKISSGNVHSATQSSKGNNV